MFTLIGGGLKEFDMSHRPTEAILPRKCHWIEARVAGICPDDSAVSLTNGRTVSGAPGEWWDYYHNLGDSLLWRRVGESTFTLPNTSSV